MEERNEVVHLARSSRGTGVIASGSHDNRSPIPDVFISKMAPQHPQPSPPLEAIAERYYQDILRFCSQFLGSREEGEDAVQELFRRVAEGRGCPPCGDGARGWLYVTARRICIDRGRWWRRYRRALELFTEEEGNADHGDSTFILSLVARLPLRQREVFILRHWHGFSTAETAELLQLHEGTVKSHLKRGVETVKGALRRDGYGR